MDNNEISMENDITDIDSNWIQEFENLDNEYKSYYAEELPFIRIHSIYVNKDNEIEKVKEEKVLFKHHGILQKEELLGIIKHNSFSNDIKYSLLSILKFNINLEPMNLKTFLKTKDKSIGSMFLQSVKNIDSIKFDKSISMFQDINDLIIIFHQQINKQTFIGPKNYTKKIFIHSHIKKKTKRKEFKDTSI